MNENLTSEEEVYVAPAEARELLARLTAKQTEGVDVSEPRTVSALAAATGVPVEDLARALEFLRNPQPRKAKWLPAAVLAVVLGVGLAVAFSNWPKPETAPAKIQTAPVEGGLVPAESLGLGGSTDKLLADPTFLAKLDLPPGLVLKAQSGRVVWGAGSANKTLFKGSLSETERQNLVSVGVDMLLYARTQAIARGLPQRPTYVGEAKLRVEGASAPVTVSIHGYQAHGMVTSAMPLQADEGELRAQAKRIMELTVDRMLDLSDATR